MTTLQELNSELDRCSACQTVARGYRHVPGGGCEHEPDLMLVFINSTVHNISAFEGWPGPPFPFANKPKLWAILAEVGLVGPELRGDVQALGATPQMVERLREEARRRRLYLTNLVKCIDDASTLPTRQRIAAWLPLLQREVEAVRPRAIVAFGHLPFRALTGLQIRLADELWSAEQGQPRLYPSLPIAGRSYPVYPCYFPTGRGNPVAATRMLRALQAMGE